MSLLGMRALVVGGAMIMACQSASDARASRTTDSAKAAGSAKARGALASRDSLSAFTVPAQCARGSVPIPQKAAPATVARAPRTKSDSAKIAHEDSIHVASASGDSVRIVGAWRDSTASARGSRAESPSAATTADTTVTRAPTPKSAQEARADSIVRARATARAKAHADSMAAIALLTDSAATRRLPGSLFPGCRVVAYYGNPMSKRMGIMGEIKPDSMLARLAKQAA
ncbi:MAG TPA: hypothetical protein VGJ12_16695, partial [Gemmatimonadaceae bacterium]